jgi:hypothetical protein
MAFLAAVKEVARRVLQRWLPVDQAYAGGSPPDHPFHWVLDRYGGGPQSCCAWHAEYGFQVNGPDTVRLIDQLSGPAQQYIEQRLGKHG